jgi:hypothetical protein
VPDEHPMEIVNDNKMPAPAAVPPTQKKSEDLFSAHDFDIKIDLEVPLPRKLLHFKQNLGAHNLFYRQPCDSDTKSRIRRQGYWSSQIIEP